MNHISTAFGIAILGYLLFIGVSSTPLQAMDRSCTPPFIWTEKALSSAARIFAPSVVPGIEKHFDNGFGECRAWVWATFYEDEYKKMQGQGSKD